MNHWMEMLTGKCYVARFMQGLQIENIKLNRNRRQQKHKGALKPSIFIKIVRLLYQLF